MKLILPIQGIILLLFLNSCKSLEVEKVGRIEIHFISWNSDFYRSQSCTDIVSVNQESKIKITDKKNVDQIVNLIRELDAREAPEFDGLDSRICVLFLSTTEDTTKTISFSPVSLMQIDGTVYETDEALFDVILGYLPADYLES